MATDIQESIQRAVNIMINHSVDALPLDKTVIGIIDSVYNSTLGLYKIKYDGGYFIAKAQQENAIFPAGMSVYVQIPQNDMSKEKFIIGRANVTKGSLAADVVISAINNYSIIGSNLFKAKVVEDGININKTGVGLYSYHDSAEEEYHPEYKNHRYQLLYDNENDENGYYNLDNSGLETYKENATGLMIEADFRSTLDNTQRYQSRGNYGIGINLVFNNSNFENGETQGEIFNYYASKINGKITIIKGLSEEEKTTFYNNYIESKEAIENAYRDDPINLQIELEKLNKDYNEKISYTEYVEEDRTILNYDEKIQESLQSSEASPIDLQGEDKILDLYASYISSLIDSYKKTYPELYVARTQEIMESYLTLLEDLKYAQYSSVQEMWEDYQSWREKNTILVWNNETKKWIEEPISSREKIITYKIDCNNMTGNPYLFNSWSSQYTLLDIDIDSFSHIDSIVFFKDGFVENTVTEQIREQDLFVRNLKVYLVQPISAVNGDYRLEIQASDGLILKTLDEEEELSIVGKTTKSYFEDLSYHTTFYWFKKSFNVTSVGHSNYHQWGGIGWAYLGKKGNIRKFVTNGAENTKYKNIYKCVGVIDQTIVLSQEFYIYNEAVQGDLEITSNLGTSFAFDSGTPLLTCLVNKEERIPEVDLENIGFIIGNPSYKYHWAVVINGQRTFLDPSLLLSADSTDVLPTENVLNTISLKNILNRVKFYAGDIEIPYDKNPKWVDVATRISYPVVNIPFESSIIFECYIEKWNETKEIYQDIGSAELAIINQGAVAANDCYITIENGEQIFQYDEYGNAPNSQKLKTPLEIKPLTCHLYKPNGIEISSGNYSLKWLLPITNTMIISEADLQSNPAQGDIKNIDINSQCKFNIASQYDKDALLNQITCQVTLGENTYTKDTNFFFGKVGNNGTNGTDVVLRIEPNKKNSILDKEPLILYRSNINNYNEPGSGIANRLTLNDTLDIRTNAGDEMIFNLAGDVNSCLNVRAYQKDEEISSASFSRTVWNVAGSTQTKNNNQGKRIKTNDDASRLYWDENYPEDDEERNEKKNNYIIKANVIYDQKSYYAFYPLPIIEYEGTLPGQSRIGIDKTYLLKEIVYNAEGRNPIYNHNQGVKLTNLKLGDYVNWFVEGTGTPDITIIGGKNDIEGSLIIETPIYKSIKGDRTYTQQDINRHPDWQKNLDYIIDETLDMIYILPKDDISGEKCDNRVIGKVYNQNNELKATVIVPIYTSLNTFGMAGINDWDGNTITLDEDRGYVMAPRVGAGKKNEENLFTGVLMGEAEDYSANEEQHLTGLFGYKNGLQSFFLDAESGNAYFGTPNLKNDTGQVRSWDGSKWVTKENYNEGRIELIPGDVSTIGGWRLGRKSLYYTSSGEIGNKYSNDYVPDKNGSIVSGTTYNSHHEKDVQENDSGILIHSGTNPYISIKGRKLFPKTTDSEILSQNADSYLLDGDSLELQLDPKTPTLFTIFRHNGNSDREKYPVGSRTFLAGINAKGQLVANGLQDVTTSQDGHETVTKFGVTSVPAFGETIEDASYTGFKMDSGDDTIAKIFIKEEHKPTSKTNPLYFSGASSKDNEYERPLSFHGETISLYSNDSNDSTNTSKNTNSYIQTTSTSAFIGHTNFSRLNLKNNNPSELYTAQKGTFSATLLDLISRSGNITLSANDGENENAKIVLNPNASSGGIDIVAARGISLTAKNSDLILSRQVKKNEEDNTITFSEKGKLTLGANSTILTRSQLASDNDKDGNYKIEIKTPQLTLNDNISGNSYYDVYGNMYLRGNKNWYTRHRGDQIEFYLGGRWDGSTVDSSGNAVRTPHTELEMNTGTNWGALVYGSAAVTSHIFYNTVLGGCYIASKIKPGAPSGEFINSINDAKQGASFTSGLSGYGVPLDNDGEVKTTGLTSGLRFNWGYFPGYMYNNTTNLSSVADARQYGQTSIAAGHKITAEGDIIANVTDNNNYISLMNHNHPFSKGVTIEILEKSSGYPTSSITQGGVGENAKINVSVSPKLTGNNASITNVENGEITWYEVKIPYFYEPKASYSNVYTSSTQRIKGEDGQWYDVQGAQISGTLWTIDTHRSITLGSASGSSRTDYGLSVEISVKQNDPTYTFNACTHEAHINPGSTSETVKGTSGKAQKG